MKSFSGNVLFLDRSDINTDEIIPAKYLTEVERQKLKPYLLEDLKLAGFDPKRDLQEKRVVLSRANFGCGSSREHAPWALEANGIHVVVAESFARIFRQNMFNCGLLALELPADIVDGLFTAFAGRATRVDTDWQARQLTFRSGGDQRTVHFDLSDFDSDLVEAGGWVEYADSKY
ncbi:MAG: 3-isopropylmalate dehydratase small subunit [Desulfosarcinaceae bacterium]|nr:3-isopropylmalate dehydratase small subunit [Desulfosarcinaceae bacterium]